MKLAIIIGLITTSAFAGKSQFLPFFDSLENRFLMDTGHLIGLSEKIKLKKIGFFGNRNAEATYSPFTNTISLKEEYLVKERRQYRIKNYDEFDRGNGINLFPVRASTIFHELGHADFDVYMERDKNHPMYKLLMQELPAWFKRHIPRVNAKTATHELFGYTAGEFILNTENQIQNILMAHGVYHNRNKCFSKTALEKIAERLGLKNEIQYVDVLNSINFQEKIIPDYIFINGKSVDVRKLPDRFKRKLIYYFSKKYNLSRNSQELIEKLNKSHFFEKLKKCYLNL